MKQQCKYWKSIAKYWLWQSPEPSFRQFLLRLYSGRWHWRKTAFQRFETGYYNRWTSSCAMPAYVRTGELLAKVHATRATKFGLSQIEYLEFVTRASTEES